MKYLLSLSFVTLLLASCSNSIVQVYDYYVMNGVEHRQDSAVVGSTATKLLFRNQESQGKSQFELIAYKKDTVKCLIFGSHVVGRSSKINKEQYHFTVTDLYSNINDKEQARQLGNLAVTFAHVDAAAIAQLVNDLPDIKARYTAAKPSKGEVLFIDYNLSKQVILSWQKKLINDKPTDCQVWVNNRKNTIDMLDLEKVLKAFSSY